MPAPMYRLETFGKLALIGGAGGSLSHQRRRLALLALLSAAGERGLSRDQLMGYLWPESTAANGRHSLEQQLHGLRRAFGESLFIGVNPVRLNPDVISSDVGEFDRAVASGELADGVALYSGPFLQGFYLEDAPEFERWVDSERRRLATRYAESLERLAETASRSGNHADSVRWRRRLVEADPVSSRFALGLMRTLAASGDRTAALQHARIYETLVRQELETEPDPSITRYAAELRSGTDAPLPQQPLLSPNRAAPVASPPATDSSQVLVSVPGSGPQGTVSSVGRNQRNWVLPALAFAAVILIIGAVVVSNRESGSAVDPDKIVVIPFRTTGADSSVNYLREGVVDLISPMLTGEGGPLAVDSRTAISTWNRVTRGREGTAEDARRVARAVGAGRVLLGSFVAAGGRLTLNGSILSVGNSDVRQLTPVSGDVDSVNTLIDSFVAQLLARESHIPEPSISTLTSHSLPAVRAYLDGRAAYRRADEDRAIRSFSRAVDLDSTFALAAFELALSTGKLLRNEICRDDSCRVFSMVPGFSLSDRADDLFDRAVRLAWDYRSKLGRRDLPLLDALHGSEYPRLSSSREILANLRRAISAAPDRPEAHYLLGVLLLYQGPALGLSDSRSQAVSAFQTASRLDSSYLAPLARMVDAAAFDGDIARLNHSAGVYLARDSAGPIAQYVRWLAAASQAGTKSRDPMLASMHRTALEHVYLTGQMTGIGIEDTDEAAALLIRFTPDPVERSFEYRRAEVLALNRGQPTKADSMLRRLDELMTTGSPSNYRTFAMAGAMFSDGDRAFADSAARDLAETMSRDTLQVLSRNLVRRTSVALSLLSLWYLEAGDTARAGAAARWLRRHVEGQPRNRVFLALPEMLIASRARRPEGARLRAFVDSVALDGCCQLPDFVNLPLARAYEQGGDDRGALRVIRRGAWYFPPRMMATYRRHEGRLAARLGDTSGAIRAYEHYLALRSNPEPRLRAQRDSVQAEVNRLRRSR